MYKTFKQSHLNREERERINEINKALTYFRGFAGSTPASREWASRKYWQLQDEKLDILEDAHDREEDREEG